MVTSADAWKKVDDGFESDEGNIEIKKLDVEEWEDGEESRYVGYMVVIWDNHAPDEIAMYKDEGTAWELAKLLTRLCSHRTLTGARMDLSGSESDVHLAGDLTDRDPEELLRDALGYNEHHLDAALE